MTAVRQTCQRCGVVAVLFERLAFLASSAARLK
jgi:hypothetical protein